MKAFALALSLLFLWSIQLSHRAFGDILTPQGHLKKLCRKIRGNDPSLEEYDALEKAILNHTQRAFFLKKTQEYLKSPEHVGRMVTRLDELFRVKTEFAPPEKYWSKDPAQAATVQSQYLYQMPLVDNSMDYLFKDVVEKNHSWDELITGKDYTVFFRTTRYQEINDDMFFRGIFSNLADNVKKDPYFDLRVHQGMKAVVLRGAPNDSRLAGAITTDRFLNRYTTSDINLNRRRSAAVTRIFLCEPLQPLVQQDLDDIKALMKFTFADHDADVHKSLLEEDSEKRHGTDPKCVGCHERLDPLGLSFATSGSTLIPQPVPGRLFFRRKNAPPVDIPGKGIGDLTQAMTTLPEYQHCQVSHFWEWFVGTDVPIEDEDELVAVFNKLGRRPNDFIAYLVNRPEFVNPPVTKKINFFSVKNTLTQCSKCHMDNDGSIAPPDFTLLPIGGDTKQNTLWITKIIHELGLRPGESQSRSMPPSDSEWQPTSKELQAIKDWILAGAPDEKGKPSLSDENLSSIRDDLKWKN